MRESSPNNLPTIDPRKGSQSGAKSLSRNILPASSFGSRFYPPPVRSTTRNLLRMNILGDGKKKMLRHRSSQEPSRLPPTSSPRTQPDLTQILLCKSEWRTFLLDAPPRHFVRLTEQVRSSEWA
jgi:hypothetical protein